MYCSSFADRYISYSPNCRARENRIRATSGEGIFQSQVYSRCQATCDSFTCTLCSALEVLSKKTHIYCCIFVPVWPQWRLESNETATWWRYGHREHTVWLYIITNKYKYTSDTNRQSERTTRESSLSLAVVNHMFGSRPSKGDNSVHEPAERQGLSVSSLA